MVWIKYEEYLDVLDMAHNGVDEHINVIGFGQWNQYYCAIKRYIGHQCSTKELDLKKEDLVTEQISKLINVCPLIFCDWMTFIKSLKSTLTFLIFLPFS